MDSTPKLNELSYNKNFCLVQILKGSLKGLKSLARSLTLTVQEEYKQGLLIHTTVLTKKAVSHPLEHFVHC